MKRTTRLRQLLNAPDILVVPGAYDGITVRLIEQAGYPCAYMTGAGTSMTNGFPDFGLLTMSEMVANAGMMANAISIPLIADCDTGYGNELNVTRAIREYEIRGVAGVHIEDQVSPKRCGHLDGKEIVSREEWLSKIKAALAARKDPDFVIIARSDARGVVGLDETIERLNDALAIGADVVMAEAPLTIEEMREVPRRVKGPCLLNVVPGGKTPVVPMSEAQSMGYALAIVPGLLIRSTMVAGDEALKVLRETGLPPGTDTKVDDVFRRFGADEWNKLRDAFL